METKVVHNIETFRHSWFRHFFHVICLSSKFILHLVYFFPCHMSILHLIKVYPASSILFSMSYVYPASHQSLSCIQYTSFHVICLSCISSKFILHLVFLSKFVLHPINRHMYDMEKYTRCRINKRHGRKTIFCNPYDMHFSMCPITIMGCTFLCTLYDTAWMVPI